VRPRRVSDATHLGLSLLARCFAWKDALIIVQPATLIRWHRQGFRLLWRWRSTPGGRLRLPANLRKLIATMAEDNSTSGWASPNRLPGCQCPRSAGIGFRPMPASWRDRSGWSPSRVPAGEGGDVRLAIVCAPQARSRAGRPVGLRSRAAGRALFSRDRMSRDSSMERGKPHRRAAYGRGSRPPVPAGNPGKTVSAQQVAAPERQGAD